MSELPEIPMDERIDGTLILGKINRAPFIVRFLWAQTHLRLLCGRCSPGTKRLRDIEDSGVCWWRENWSRGNFDIPFWMGWSESHRLEALRRKKLERGEWFPVISSAESAIKHQLSRLLRRS